VRRLGRHPAEIPVAEAALEDWRSMPDLVGDDCGFHASGQIKLAENEAELETLGARAEMVGALGYGHEEIIDRAEMRELIPSVADHCVGAMIVRGDGYADPYRTCVAFRRAAEAAGVTIHEGVAAEALDRDGNRWRVSTPVGRFEAPEVLNAAGAWGAVLSRRLGEPVPVRGAAYMMMVTDRQPRFVEPVVGLASRKLSLKQMANGTVVIGGGHEGRPDMDTGATALVLAGLAKSAAVASQVFPVLRNARLVRAWAGIDGEAVDGIPVIGRSLLHEGLTHAFGFSGRGFQLVPAVGRILAQLIRTGRTDLSIEAFSPARFREVPE
jgi:sarcosine oxidase subunit beta